MTFILAAGPTAAFAHGGDPHGEVPAWTFDPYVVAALGLAALLYGAGTWRLWLRRRRSRRVGLRQAGLYGAGWIILAGALLSPLHWLGEHMFTFHMIEHEVIMAVAAPLLAAARLVGTALWARPRRVRLAWAGLARSPAVSAGWRSLTQPRTATLLHGAALWLWHVPALLDASVADIGIHRLQHLSVLGSALLFWWAMFRRAEAGAAVAHLFITMLHMSLLGALIALSPRLLYPVQTAQAAQFGFTALEDQQLAGVVMWVPACTIYAGAALVFAALWIQRSGTGWRGSDAPSC